MSLESRQAVNITSLETSKKKKCRQGRKHQLEWEKDCLGIYYPASPHDGVIEIYDFGIFNTTKDEVKVYWQHSNKLNANYRENYKGTVVFNIVGINGLKCFSMQKTKGTAFVDYLTLEKNQTNWDGIHVDWEIDTQPLSLIRVPIFGRYASSMGHKITVQEDANGDIEIEYDGCDEGEYILDWDAHPIEFFTSGDNDKTYIENIGTRWKCYLNTCKNGNLLWQWNDGEKEQYDLWTRIRSETENIFLDTLDPEPRIEHVGCSCCPDWPSKCCLDVETRL